MNLNADALGAKLTHILCLPGLVLFLLLTIPGALRAQTAGEGTITGTVVDTTGAAVPNATITTTNTATNISTARTSSGSGVFTVAPLLPGTYSVTVVAEGFKTLKQNALVVNAMGVLTFNPILSVGAATQTVEVSGAPPVLNTSTATLGLTIEHETYSNLPLQMSGAQRDPTAFAVLTPGTQSGQRMPIVGGSGSYLGQLYLDGMPAETVSQQGDNRLVSLAVSVDAVDQFQMVTSTAPAEFSGEGSENFTMKSGGLNYHGQASGFFRNTAFDAWAFTAKGATTTNSAGQTVLAPKPVEHQTELSFSLGGKVPHTGKKLFFFVAFDKYHERLGASLGLMTIPTSLMRTGDFTELANESNTPFLYDPTSTNCMGGVCTRQPFQVVKNGVPTYNMIPTSYLSPIALKMESFMPDPTSSGVTNNYFGGQPSGFDNHTTDYRVDYDISSKNRISTVGAIGVEDYLNNYISPLLPLPYVGGDLASVFPKVFDVEDAYIISPRMTNQLKYGYTRFFQNIQDTTQGMTQYEPATLGITNLPGGQASEEFPGASFATTPAFGSVQSQWTSSRTVGTQLTTPNNYTIVDNLQWLKGRHSLTFGLQFQWQQINNANPATYTGVLPLSYNAFSTANFSANSNSLTTGTASSPSGYSYASYLLGAVGGTPSLALQPVSEVGGRYKAIAPYVQDSWKVNEKLTFDLGLRWDYLPPYHEVQNRWSFLNPSLTNTITGTAGMLQFAGNHGGPGVSCGCKTPVHTYYKYWGPRIGIAYAANPKTVFRLGYGLVYTQGGGVGGRDGSYNGTGQTGFNTTAIGSPEITTGAAAGPSFYLNNGSYFSGIGMANTGLFGPGFTYPANPTPGPASQTLETGFYVNGNGKFVSAGGVGYADPYFSGRAPQMSTYNFGVERAITNDMTLAVNYVGDETHFIQNNKVSSANARGYWSGEMNPKYLVALGGVTTGGATPVPILTAPATPANVAKAQVAMPGLTIPTFYQQAAMVNSSATIAQGLVAFPQYSGMTDTFGNVGNYSYNSLQITLIQRFSHGLTFNVNYTFAKNIGDDGTYRTGFNLPSGSVSGTSQAFKQNRIDRSWTVFDQPQTFHAFGVYRLPFGKGAIGNKSFLVRTLAGGWQLSSIYSYSSGAPVAVIWSGCNGTNFPGQGQCDPDVNPSFSRSSARIHGSYGTGPNGTVKNNLGNIKYIDSSAFQAPGNISSVQGQPQYLIGNVPRTRAFNLNNPGTQDLDAAVHRTFPLREGLSFVFEADCLNVWNKVTMGSPSASWSSGSSTFGEVTSASSNARDWQFAGHITF